MLLVFLLTLVSASAASAQVVISARIGNPYYAPRPYYGPGYYPPVAPVMVAPPVYYAPAPVYYAPRPIYYAPRPYYGRGYYGRGYGRRW
ncbi:hypothetical protein [Hymenobacter sp. BRD67]|uniref:hypothetical protein n=1 Tax=Hymenobacter sp. BRD67 TaxID=2675877 RepID=UPI00293C0C72|nr:hypothetical protein [Hymenobacter sp. BRD67]